ncbi:MAG: response regulator transcription factor [Anaerolineae bacterium]|nr:response regulator transcription factor [Anaerolineae bacterium]
MPALRILLADDHPLFRHGLAALLKQTPDFEVVGEATTGEEVVALANSLQPDLVLMDIRMPGVNGIEATRRILAARPTTRVLVVTMFEDDASVFTAMRAGARGYILKDADKDEMLRAIRAVGSGEAIFSPAIATRMIEFFAAPRPAAASDAFPDLTEREREILNLMAQGMNNVEIAQRLVLSHPTVRNYVSSIFSKLQVADRAQAIVRAREAGLGHDKGR